MSTQILSRTTALAALSLAVAAAGGSTAAHARAQLDRAEFTMTLTATQETSWVTDELQHDPCGGLVIASEGAGRQKFTITIDRRPVIVERVRMLGTVVTNIRPRGAKPTTLDPFRVDVAAERSGAIRNTTVLDEGRICAEGGSGEAPEPVDCGPKALKGRLSLTPAIRRRGRGLGMVLRGPLLAGGFEDLLQAAYRNCAFNGPTALIEAPMTVISAGKLFGRGRQLIAWDEHELNEQYGGLRISTKLSWRMRLVRRGGR